MSLATSSINNKTAEGSTDSRKYLNRYLNQPINYIPSEVDAVIGYFLKRGFDEIAAVNTASVLLQQAYVDNIPVFQLVDTLRGVTDVQLSNIVAQILNISRSNCSTIGYRVSNEDLLFDQRNVII